MLQCSIDTANSVEKINSQWYHEMERIFCDRLIDENDRQWFKKVATSISQRFGEGVSLDKIKRGDLGITFTSIMTLDTDEKIYEEIDEVKKIIDFL